MQVHQRGAAGDHELLEVLLGGLDLLVDALELNDQLDREPTPGLADDVARPDGGDERPGLVRGEELLCSAWESSNNTRCARRPPRSWQRPLAAARSRRWSSAVELPSSPIVARKDARRRPPLGRCRWVWSCSLALAAPAYSQQRLECKRGAEDEDRRGEVDESEVTDRGQAPRVVRR
jgi:hypothetical protein